MVSDSKTRCVRHGKTAKDKARGHVAYRKNRRVWTGDNPADLRGCWQKA